MNATVEREFDALVEAAFEDATRRLDGTYTRLDADAGRLQDRRYDVAGVQVAVSLKRERNCIGFYADMGLPLPGGALSACRRLLELNHTGPHGLVRFGMHPQSRRLVATAQVPAPHLHLQPDLAESAVADLARQACELRASLEREFS